MKNKTKAPFDFLEGLSENKLADFLKKEEAATTAITLAHMDTAFAAGILKLLPSDVKIEVAIRMSNLKDTTPSIIKNISILLKNKLEAPTENKVELGGVRNIADIFTKMGKEGKETLNSVKLYDEELAKNIDAEMKLTK